MLCDQDVWWLAWNPWNHGSIFIIVPWSADVNLALPETIKWFLIYLPYMVDHFHWQQHSKMSSSAFRAARIVFNLLKDMVSHDVLERAKWFTIRFNDKLAIFKCMHEAYNGRLPSALISFIVKKRDPPYSIRACDSLAVPRFNIIFYEGPRCICKRCPSEYVFQIHWPCWYFYGC